MEDWSSPRWRIEHLYWVLDDQGNEVKFKLREVQAEYLDNLWPRNVNLKSRQHGSSTLISLLQLDQCIWNKNFRAATICDTLDNARKMFRDKVMFPWHKLPGPITEAVGIKKQAADEIEFGNGSVLSVTTSARSGTLQSLHISEYGKICAKFPEKAKEIKSGSIPAVVQNGGVIHIESTAEGQEGDFYEMVATARQRQDQKKPLTVLDYRLHFFPWFKKSANVLDPVGVIVPKHLVEYFAMLKVKHGLEFSPHQMAWYVKTAEALGNLMKREHPTLCVAAQEQVFTPAGLVKIVDAVVDGSVVTAHLERGIKPVFKLTTESGYEVTATADHRVKTPTGFVEIKALSVGDPVVIASGVSGLGSPQKIEWVTFPVVKSSVEITEQVAEFMGLYMGDGCYSGLTLSVTCTREDVDVINRVKDHIKSLFGIDAAERVIGSKSGGVEIRVGCARLPDIMRPLQMVKQKPSGSWKRSVCVPDCIKRSPDVVVAAFLRGLFEADGFAQRNGTGVKFFTKYEEFGRDVQLLLLRLGITLKRNRKVKRAGSGAEYVGYELCLRTQEAIEFGQRIGFISARKQARVMSQKTNPLSVVKRNPLMSEDRVSLIESSGVTMTYDLTTASHEFAAGGIVVHNCDEAFEASTEGAIFQNEMTILRKRGSIGAFKWDPRFPVNTFWDFGVSSSSGSTAVWFHQRIDGMNRLIDFMNETDQGIGWWVNQLRSKPYTYQLHYMPHDVRTRMQGEQVVTREQLFNDKAIYNIRTVPRVSEIGKGIEMLRSFLLTCEFDEKGCSEGIKGVDSYRREWDEKAGRWSERPLHNYASDVCDSLRQAAQGYSPDAENWTHQMVSIPAVEILDAEVGY